MGVDNRGSAARWGGTRRRSEGDAMGRPLQVVKLGGSALERPGWEAALRLWLDRGGRAERLLVVGGGNLVDVLRERHRSQRLPDALSHRLALRAMQLNTAFVAERLPGTVWVDTAELLRQLADRHAGRRTAGGTLGLVDPWPLFDDPSWNHPLGPVPTSWEATSDSLAAWLAAGIRADELVLLKSCLPALDSTPTSAARSGYVDTWFPQAAALLPRIRCVDLFGPGLPEWTLRPDAPPDLPVHPEPSPEPFACEAPPAAEPVPPPTLDLPFPFEP